MLLTDQQNSFLNTAAVLAREFAEDAVERDKAGGIPKVQLERIRESGLLKLLIPAKYGGYGQTWSVVLRVVREIAKADASLAHLYGYHFLNLTRPHLTGSSEQRRFYYTETAQNNWFWGNSVNPLDRRLFGKRVDNRFVLDGINSFSSGSHYADRLVISWREDENAKDLFLAVIPTSRPGVTVNHDWDNMGQRQTGSGSISFKEVVVEDYEVLDKNRYGYTVFATLVPILSQSILANIFVGIAEGAIEAAKQYTTAISRPWYTSGVEKASEDPAILRQYGEFWLETQAAASLADKAASKLDEIWEQEFSLTEQERGECAVLVAAVNVLAGKVGLDISNRIFEVMGARSTASRYGFDRFWRNVRTHTLHNPVEYKLRNIGDYFLNGKLPSVGFYS